MVPVLRLLSLGIRNPTSIIREESSGYISDRFVLLSAKDGVESVEENGRLNFETAGSPVERYNHSLRLRIDFSFLIPFKFWYVSRWLPCLVDAALAPALALTLSKVNSCEERTDAPS